MNKTFNWQIGIDEVGRGPVAGPVCVGIVALPVSVGIYTNYFLERNGTKVPLVRGQAEGLGVVKVLGVASDAHQSNILPDTLRPKLRDSKKTTAKFRQQVFSSVDNLEAEYLVLQASPELIDAFGIAVCIRHLMLIGLVGLFIIKSELINDSQIFLDGTLKFQDEYNLELLNLCLVENKDEFARLNPDLKGLEQSLKPDTISDFIKNITGDNNPSENLNETPRIIMENFADDKYFAVALASNLAKHFRDEIMIKEGLKYPNYFLDKNMGYGTAKHMLAIKENGLKMIHRKSFLKKYLPEN